MDDADGPSQSRGERRRPVVSWPGAGRSRLIYRCLLRLDSSSASEPFCCARHAPFSSARGTRVLSTLPIGLSQDVFSLGVAGADVSLPVSFWWPPQSTASHRSRCRLENRRHESLSGTRRTAGRGGRWREGCVIGGLKGRGGGLAVDLSGPDQELSARGTTAVGGAKTESGESSRAPRRPGHRRDRWTAGVKRDQQRAPRVEPTRSTRPQTWGAAEGTEPRQRRRRDRGPRESEGERVRASQRERVGESRAEDVVPERAIYAARPASTW